MGLSARPGSGAQQEQYATVRVRNNGTSTCVLTGFPTARLRVGGQDLGRAAQPAGGSGSTVRLAPGRSAVASLHGPTTCNAPVSDHVRLSLPHRATPVDAVLRMRGCPLVIERSHAE